MERWNSNEETLIRLSMKSTFPQGKVLVERTNTLSINRYQHRNHNLPRKEEPNMPALQIMLKPASSACNLRCAYCFYHEEANHRACADRGMMTEKTAKTVIAKAFDYAGNDDDDAHISFSFQGGEPLLAGLTFFRFFVDAVKERNKFHIPVEYALQTNGTLLDEDLAAFFAKEQFLIGLSLDGIPTIHDRHRTDAHGEGTYDTVCSAAALLEKHKAAYNVLCVVTDALCAHGEAVWSALREHRYLQFIPCLPPMTDDVPSFAPTEEYYARFLSDIFRGYYRDFRAGTPVSVRTFDNWLNLLLRQPPESCAMCGVCMPSLVVESNGDVYPCDFYALDEWRLGNLCDGSSDISSLLSSPRLKEFLQASRAVPLTCRRCRYYPLCRNGCRRERTLTDGRTRHCQSYRRFFDRHIGQLEEMADMIEYHMKQKGRTP